MIPAIGSEVIRLDPRLSGQTDPVVSQVQQALNQISGSTVVPETGIFNPETEEQLRRFQRSRNIPVSGIINQQTIDALNHTVENDVEGNTRPEITPEERAHRRLEQTFSGEARRATLGDSLRNNESARMDALRSLATEPHNVRVHGVDIPVHGGSTEERALIQRTLERLPEAHVRTIPRIVVADTVGNGTVRNGGASITDAVAEQHLHGSRFRNYRRGIINEGLGNLLDREASGFARIELTHNSLQGALRRGRDVSGALLHETAHFVDAKFRLSGQIQPDDLGGIVYSGRNQGDDPRGPVGERLGDAYMHFFMGNLNDPVALNTMQRLLERNTPQPEVTRQQTIIQEND